MTDDDRAYEQKRDEAFARAVGQILGTLRAMNFNNMMFTIALVLAVTFNTCLTAGCTSPMSTFEVDVGEACQAREQERTAAGCGPEVYPEGPCEARVAAAERCWGPAERLWWCEAGAEWACWPWGATTGSQCDVEYVELRDCMRQGDGI
jgi:hypothetical protein